MNEIKKQLQELMAAMAMYAENQDGMPVVDFVNDCLDILGGIMEELDDCGPVNEPIDTEEYHEAKKSETFDVAGNNKIADHYGYFWQRDMLTEECAEVIQAVNKCRRCCIDAQDNFLGELADIKVLLAQMEHFLNEDKITAIANEKIARELNRIEKEKRNEAEDD
jgi:NTP pyrophosphatase (non-canonical NTP hydrolase)